MSHWHLVDVVVSIEIVSDLVYHSGGIGLSYPLEGWIPRLLHLIELVSRNHHTIKVGKSTKDPFDVIWNLIGDQNSHQLRG